MAYLHLQRGYLAGYLGEAAAGDGGDGGGGGGGGTLPPTTTVTTSFVATGSAAPAPSVNLPQVALQVAAQWGLPVDVVYSALSKGITTAQLTSYINSVTQAETGQIDVSALQSLIDGAPAVIQTAPLPVPISQIVNANTSPETGQVNLPAVQATLTAIAPPPPAPAPMQAITPVPVTAPAPPPVYSYAPIPSPAPAPAVTTVSTSLTPSKTVTPSPTVQTPGPTSGGGSGSMFPWYAYPGQIALVPQNTDTQGDVGSVTGPGGSGGAGVGSTPKPSTSWLALLALGAAILAGNQQ